MMVRVELGADGTVQHGGLAGANSGAPIDTCVGNALSATHFSKPGRAVTVDAPFVVR
jgi:hypothetical protein